ncbi:MAG: glycosyltransferase [Blastopirellula sp.]|nr:MAG: glycosyltransferase [Blastopirellula sp.]
MSERVNLFGIELDAVTMRQAVDTITQWTDHGSCRLRFVVTPNVDHTVLLQENKQLRDAYSDAELVLADGWPVVWASRMLKKAVPQRVPGSDLVPNIFSAAKTDNPLRTFLLGAAPGVARRAANKIKNRYQGVNICGTYSPPMGFENDDAENYKIIDLVNRSNAQLLILGLGAPKQELWIHRHRHELQADVAICAGATIDFLAGEKSRAPQWMQQTGLEWAHRILTDPKRLARRYAKDAIVFPQMMLKEWMHPSRRQKTVVG